MTDDTNPDSRSDAHWHQQTIDAVIDPIESELVALQRDAGGRLHTAVATGRGAVDRLETALRDAAAGEPPDQEAPYEEADGVDVSEQRKRP